MQWQWITTLLQKEHDKALTDQKRTSRLSLGGTVVSSSDLVHWQILLGIHKRQGLHKSDTDTCIDRFHNPSIKRWGEAFKQLTRISSILPIMKIYTRVRCQVRRKSLIEAQKIVVPKCVHWFDYSAYHCNGRTHPIWSSQMQCRTRYLPVNNDKTLLIVKHEQCSHWSFFCGFIQRPQIPTD